jgi:hypothetical protein
MNKITIQLSLIFLLIPFLVFSQITEEEIVIRINNISTEIKPNENITKQLKKLKQITTKTKKDYQKSAVANALAGKILSEKGYSELALPFLEKSYFFRQKQGRFEPQKWALSSLIDNRIEKEDYKSATKYIKQWMKLAEIHKSDTTRSPYGVLRLLLIRLSPTEHLSYRNRKGKETDKSWQERRKYGHLLIKYALKKYPKYRDAIISGYPEHRINYYSYLVEFTAHKDIEIAKHWEKEGLKLAKKYRTPKEYSDHIRYFITIYNGTEGWFTQELKPSSNEKEGIRLTNKYIKVCKRIKRHDQVTFGYRYLSKRLRISKKYAKSVQALAEAIKYCRKHNMSELEIERALRGMMPIINKIASEKDKKGFIACKEWKKKFSLKGLNSNDIRRIDDLIQSVNKFEFKI